MHICDSLFEVHKNIDDIPVFTIASNDPESNPDIEPEPTETTTPAETPEPVETPAATIEPTPAITPTIETTPTQEPTEEPTSTPTPMPDFFIHDIEIEPSLARLSDTVTFIIKITNQSDSPDYYTINIRIDGNAFASRDGLLQAGQSQRFRLSKTNLTVGKHLVQVYGYDGDGYQTNRQESNFTVIHD